MPENPHRILPELSKYLQHAHLDKEQARFYAVPFYLDDWEFGNVMTILSTARGRCLPVGASSQVDGVNFVVPCRHGTKVSLVLYSVEPDEVLAEIDLDGLKNRTGDHWHIFVSGLPPVFRYGWRIDGPAGNGNRFDPTAVLLDPAATAISGGNVWGTSKEPDKKRSIRRSMFFRRSFNWREDVPPRIPLEDSVIYELHVRGFTQHASSGVKHPGTFAGLIEKIPYLQWLGVTAVELLPIHEFDECDCPFVNPLTQESLRNLWGYNSLAFAAPKSGYAASGAHHGQIIEFREMIRAFHAAGIEVILDVVFNHTGEGDERGRTSSFRGLDNRLYYMLGPGGSYLNFSGCGNTLNCNHPVVRQLLMDCLRYWVADMHVDGLRFDLASVMGRNQFGEVMVEPPIVESIAKDGVLADTKLIAEPWDAVGLYQVGGFPFGRRWSEWNGRYRDDVRRFWRGEPGFAGALATRLCGSSDLYQASGRLPRHSVNFVTCHDGFTLWDLVSYNRKHNEANGEENRDGLGENFSSNCGVEGDTSDPEILQLRRRLTKNIMATLLLSQGVPMLLAGDEFLRSQRGNNNAWCQDNDLSWIDWELSKTNAEMLRFTRNLLAFRKRHPALRRRRFFNGAPAGSMLGDIVWHGITPDQPDFSSSSRCLALTLNGKLTGQDADCDIYMAFNAWQNDLTFELPPAPCGGPWKQIVDTANPAPRDFVQEEKAAPLPSLTPYRVHSFSMIVLVAER